MPRVRSTYSAVFALVAVSIFSSGCLESQKKQASAACKAKYVGRHKAACDIGVNNAAEVAAKKDGKSANEKYRLAVADCKRLEPPLVPMCLDGVNSFKSEIARNGSSEIEPTKPKVASKGKRTKGSRSIASSK